MTDTATAAPASPGPAPVTPSAPAADAQPSPAAAPAPSGPRDRMADVVARRAARKAAVAPPATEKPEAPGTAPSTPEAPAQATAPEADERATKLAEIRKRQEEYDQRRRVSAEQAKASQELADLRARVDAQAKELEAAKSRPSAETVWQEMQRDPVAATRKYGGDPQKILNALTQDMLSQGTVRTETEAKEAIRIAKEAQEKLDAVEKTRAEERQAASVEAERRAFAAAAGDASLPTLSQYPEALRLAVGVHVAGQMDRYDRRATLTNAEQVLKDALDEDAVRWPHLSKLPLGKRIKMGLDPWSRFAHNQNGFDADASADEWDAHLAELAKPPSTAPQQTPAPADSRPSASAPPKTLTASLASQASGDSRVRLSQEDKLERIKAKRAARAR